MTYLRNGVLNGSGVVLVTLLPGALNLQLHSPLLSFGIGLATVPILLLLFPRRYRLLKPSGRSTGETVREQKP